MIAEVANKRDEIADICRRYGVARLELFGSAARGDFDPETSDIDFIYEFERPDNDLPGRFFGLIEELETLLGRPVDIITDKKRSNPYVWASIDLSRRVIFGDET